MTTYEELVTHLKEKAKLIHDKPITVFIRNTETGRKEIITFGTNKKYNWAYIVYDPIYVDPYGFSVSSNEERASYICHTLEEAREIGDFLLDNSEYWSTKIDSEDMLEQFLHF